ncbi:MAG: SAM-dependent DNA methyltransferase, partial [Actinomycetota bacterium]|nr:SAM-dependent DNA methyltransferase [Actinomycetota bacterium]
DARIRVGNSLLGTTPALLAGEVPDEAFKELEGDDKKIAAATRKRNKAERGGQYRLEEVELVLPNTELAKHREPLLTLADGVATVREQADAWHAYLSSDEQLQLQRAQADAWCAAFVWNLAPDGLLAPTSGVVRGFLTAPRGVDAGVRAEVARLADEYRFFHWHLEFPEVFTVSGANDRDAGPDGWTGGFSCLAGNPPWERIAFEDDEFFGQCASEVLTADTTEQRKQQIQELIERDTIIAQRYEQARRWIATTAKFIGNSGLYPLAAHGRLTTQAPFTEQSARMVAPSGRCGVIVPTGVLTDVPIKGFWKHLSSEERLRAVIDFSNAKEIFPGVHRSTKFCILVTTGAVHEESKSGSLRIGVFLEDPGELQDPDRLYDLPVDALSILNPITLQMPICRSRRDIELLLIMTKAVGRGERVVPWVGFTSEGHSKFYLKGGFSTATIPLFEGKMMHQYDANFATYAGVSESDRSAGKPRGVSVNDKSIAVVPRFYCDAVNADKFLSRKNESRPWIFVVRDYVRSTDEHTAIASVVPRTVPIQPLNGFSPPAKSTSSGAWVLAAINSLPYDYIARQKTPGQHFNVTIMSQIPIPAVDYEWIQLVTRSVAKLTYTTPGLESFAVDLGVSGSPFLWHEDRRAQIRAEIDALFFRLYGASRADAEYILDTFPIVKRKDETKYGEYRTKRLVLEVYDRIAEVIATAEPYRTILDPPPGQGPRHAPR